jgi:hypothetical protein
MQKLTTWYKKVTWFFFILSLNFFSCLSFAKSVEIDFGQSSNGVYILPVPKDLIPLNTQLTFFCNGRPIDTKIRAMLTWPADIDTGNKFARLLYIKLIDKIVKRCKVQMNWQLSSQDLPMYYGSFSQSVLLFPDYNWLKKAVLINDNEAAESDWYVEAQKLQANFVTDEQAMTELNYPLSQTSHWLYDKPKSLLQLFLRDEKLEWLIKADRYADYYASNLDENGFFSLAKNKDIKYLMSQGILFQYILTGNTLYKKAISNIFDASLNWKSRHNYGKKFWTERNQAAALQAAIAEWEMSSTSVAHDRIREIIDDTYAATFQPKNDWPIRNCPQHTLHSHEGKGKLVPVCSPWMMALLADGVWRYHQLTGSKKSAELLSAFGDFFADYGFYYGKQKEKQVLAPRYLSAFENAFLIENNIWTDPHHNCDVAGMLGKSVHIKTLYGHKTERVREIFKKFGSMCRTELEKVRQLNAGKGRAKVRPPRRFGWVYSSTYELPWFIEKYGG